MIRSIVKSIVEARGYECIKEPNFVNVLADQHAFEECLPAKFIFKTIIQEGYADKLYVHFENGSAHTFAERIVEDLFSKFGFRRDLIFLIVNSLLYALGLPELSNGRVTTPPGNETNEHIIFSGISLGHSIGEIEKHLLNRGFATVKTKPYQIKMIGTFCGINDVKLYINGSPLGVTRGISLIFKQMARSFYFDWCQLLYDLLRDKYGVPDFAKDPLHTIGKDTDLFYKDFLKYSEMEKNYEEILEYKWKVEGGEIELCWIGDHINLLYYDTANIELAENHQQQFNRESI